MKQGAILTKQRKAVLDIVASSEDHPSAADVMERLQTQGYRFAYGTVYNSLRFLSEEGLIQELQVGDGMSRYDGRIDSHSHVVCRSCGAIEEFSLPGQSDLLSVASLQSTYTLDTVNVVFYGLCKQCHLG